MAIYCHIRPLRTGSRGLNFSGKLEAWIKDKFRLLAKRVADQLARIFIANGNPGEISQLVRPTAVQPVRCIVIAKARGLGRSEERRVGQEFVSPFRSRCSPNPYKKNTYI